MKNIGKIKAIIISSVIVFVMVVGLLMSFVPAEISSKDFESFSGAIKKATSIDAGMSVEYEMKGEYSDEEISSSIKILTGIISEYGFKSVNAYRKGDNKIRVDLNAPVLFSERSSCEDFLSKLASGKLEFKNKNDAKASLTPKEGETVDPTLIIIDATKHIEKVSTVNYSQAAGVKIDFNNEGKSLYSASVGSPLYMFVGGKAWPSEQGNEISANTDPSATSMYLMFSSVDAVDSYYYTIKAGMMSIELDSDKVDIVYNTNKSALTARVAGFVLTIVVAVALITLLAVKYKGFAIAPVVSSLILLAIELFLLQAMDWVVFGFTGFVALIFMTILNYILNAHIFSSIKAEQKVGKSLATSTDDGYRKNLWVVIDALSVTFIIGLVLALISTGEMVAVGTILALSALFMAVEILLFNRLIINCIFSIFGKNEKIFGLQNREEV